MKVKQKSLRSQNYEGRAEERDAQSRFGIYKSILFLKKFFFFRNANYLSN